MCSRLCLGDVIVTDTKDLLDGWADHFHSLGKSQSIHNPALQTSERSANEHMSASFGKCNNILDSNLSVEEVEYTIYLLKRNRSGGFDGISPEHLKFCGPVFRN